MSEYSKKNLIQMKNVDKYFGEFQALKNKLTNNLKGDK